MNIKRKVTNKEYIRKLLDYKTNEQLKQICRQFKIKGFSKFGKTDLVDFVHSSLTDEQLEEVFDFEYVSSIYSESRNSSLDWGLEKIYEIVKNVNLGNNSYYRPVNIEKKNFGNVEIKGIIEEKRIDFTISFVFKMMQRSIRTIKGRVIKSDYMLALRKKDYFFVQEVNQEGLILHQIYEINFGDFPEDFHPLNAKDWTILAYANLEDGNYYEAMDLYKMLLSDFKVSKETKIDLSKKLDLARKTIRVKPYKKHEEIQE